MIGKQIFFIDELSRTNLTRPVYLLQSRHGHLSVFQWVFISFNSFYFFLNLVIEDSIFSLQGFSDTDRNTGASGASMCSSGIIHNGITIFESSLG